MSIIPSAATNGTSPTSPEREVKSPEALAIELLTTGQSMMHGEKDAKRLLRQLRNDWRAEDADMLDTLRVQAEQKIRAEIAEDFVRQGKASHSLSWGQAREIALNGLCSCSGGIKPCDMGGAS